MSLDRSGSSPGGFIVYHVPVENGPSISMCSMPAFQVLQPGTSRKMLQMMSAVADVSIPYSPRQTCSSLIVASSLCMCAYNMRPYYNRQEHLPIAGRLSVLAGFLPCPGCCAARSDAQLIREIG